MANDVEICNLALSRIGCESKIQNLQADISREATACRVHYEINRNAVLEAHPWGFAKRRETLSLLAEQVEGWNYAYNYPNNCLLAREIFNAQAFTRTVFIGCDEQRRASEIPFEILSNANLNGTIIGTDEADAILVFTAKITNPTLFSSLFADALASLMASDLSVALWGDTSKQNTFYQVYRARLGDAQRLDANQQYKAPNDDSSYVDSRM